MFMLPAFSRFRGNLPSVRLCVPMTEDTIPSVLSLTDSCDKPRLTSLECSFWSTDKATFTLCMTTDMTESKYTSKYTVHHISHMHNIQSQFNMHTHKKIKNTSYVSHLVTCSLLKKAPVLHENCWALSVLCQRLSLCVQKMFPIML